MNSIKKFIFVGMVVIFFLGMIGFLGYFGVNQIFSNMRLQVAGEEKVGIIESIQVDGGRRSRSYARSYYVIYDKDGDGKAGREKVHLPLFSLVTPYGKGDTVTVIQDPKNPENTTIYGGVGTWVGGYIAGIFSVMFSMVMVMFFVLLLRSKEFWK